MPFSIITLSREPESLERQTEYFAYRAAIPVLSDQHILPIQPYLRAPLCSGQARMAYPGDVVIHSDTHGAIAYAGI